MTKYNEALKEYNHGKDKWCMPRKGSDDYKLIIKIIEKNKVIKASSKEPKIKVSKEPKLKVSKEHKSKTVINLPISMNSFSNKKYSKSTRKTSKQRSSVFIPQVNTKKNAIIIANFLKNKLIKNKYTLDNRVSFYKYINNLLVDINGNECLESKVYNSRKGYTIKNKINLYKQIGTESAYGVIYLTSIANSFGGFTIASKVMPNNKENIKEIAIMKYIADEVLLKNRSKHFVLMYKHAICNKKPFDDKHRIVCVNELAHGDLKMLMTKRELLKDNELIMNLLFQTFISIGTLHNIVNYSHNDSHYGNFLYQKNNEEGYYEYTFDGVSYYLKSCGYNIMIYDFGLSTKINSNKNYKLGYIGFSKDYRRICNAFMSKIYGWGQYDDLPNLENNVKIIRLKTLLGNISSINYKDFFKQIIEKFFIPSSPKDMWITERPKNVINKIAFDMS